MNWADVGRIAFTVFCFAVFVIILVGAFSKNSKNRYNEASNLPFLDDEQKQ